MNRERAGLFALWFIVTSANLFKPYTIDDTAHLTIARWIAGHPLHPMVGPLNWTGSTEPIYATNQPHLYFYLLAGWGRVFGFGNVAMHGLQSIFAGVCIVVFHRMARQMAASHALWLTTMLALNPAFIVEQNLMVDVPLLACWLAFFEQLVCGSKRPDQNRRYGLAALFCAAAVLIKYSSLILLPVLGCSMVMERRWRQAWCLGVPVGVLGLWSAFNLFDYGGVHLMTAFHSSAVTYKTRPHKSVEFLRKLVKFGLAWGIAVGALTPFGVIALAQRFPRRAGLVFAVWLGGFLALVLSVASHVVSGSVSDRVLFVAFFSSFLLLFTVMRPLGSLAKRYLVLWLVFTTLFYVFLAPFIAARHVLLVLPAISLLAASGAPLPRFAKAFGLLVTVPLAVGLTVSDFRFARFFEQQALALPAAFPPGTKLWCAGHWGWQYYATRAGMTELDVKVSRLKAGDVILIARETAHQLPADLKLHNKGTITGNASFLDPFCTGRPSLFYISYSFRGPWSLSTACDEHIDIMQVSK